MIPFLFPLSDILSKIAMATLNLPGFTLSILVWYLNPPTPPKTHISVLTLIQLIERMLNPPHGPSMNSHVSTPLPRHPNNTGEISPK